MCKTRTLQKEAKQHLDAMRDLAPKAAADWTTNSRVMVEMSGFLSCLGQIAEISTRRIVFLTLGLLVFTMLLFGIEVRKVFVEKYPNASSHQVESAQHQQIVIPAITNR